MSPNEPARELPPKVDHARAPVDRTATEAEVTLIADRRMTAPGDAEGRQVRQAAHRRRGLECVSAELGVAIGVLGQVHPGRADCAAAGVARSTVFARADELAGARRPEDDLAATGGSGALAGGVDAADQDRRQGRHRPRHHDGYEAAPKKPG